MHDHAQLVVGVGPRRLNTRSFDCDRCQNNNTGNINTAIVACGDCKELLCKTCYSFHDNDVTLKSHRILTLAAQARETAVITKELRPKGGKPVHKNVIRNDKVKSSSHLNGYPSVKGPTTQDVRVPFTGRKTKQSISATFIGEFSVNISSDKHDSKIYDISSTMDGKYIVVSDDRNSKMKIFTSDHKLHSSLAFAYLPGHVTCLNESTIAMAMSNEILYFKFKGTKLTQMPHKLSLKGDVTGIVKHVDTLAVTYEMFSSQSRIGIISPKGTEKVLNKSELAAATERWGRVAIFKNKSKSTITVVVLEDDSGMLGCYDTNGERIWTCEIPQAGSWQGGASTKMGGVVAVANVVLVTDVVNNVFHLVTENGEYRGVFMDESDGLFRPYAVCYNPKGRLLYVTQFRNDTVKVFGIK